MTNPETSKRLPLPKKALRDFILSIPAMLAVLAAYLYSFNLFDATPQWGAVGLGALGWFVALNLRFPFTPLIKKMGQEKGGLFMAALSGPCEELVRLAAVLLLGRSFPIALSIGIGWGAIEILFALITGAMRLVLLTKDDEQARQAKEMLAAQGLLDLPASWLVGAWERLFATGIHVGFTLLVAWDLRLVFLLLPLHTLTNLAIPTIGKRSIWIVEAIVTVTGGIALALGLLAFGQL